MKLTSVLFTLALWNPTPDTCLDAFNDNVISVSEKTVSFTLRNESTRSIPLIIPGVMNPNLSPFSNSGVNLKPGQEIFFRHKGKKRLLLKVDETLEGQTIKVAKLLKERKDAL